MLRFIDSHSNNNIMMSVTMLRQIIEFCGCVTAVEKTVSEHATANFQVTVGETSRLPLAFSERIYTISRQRYIALASLGILAVPRPVLVAISFCYTHCRNKNYAALGKIHRFYGRKSKKFHAAISSMSNTVPD
jgi:hypothetical protein